MKDLSRRELLRASAGAAAVAVPMVALAGPANAASRSQEDADSALDLSAGAALGTVIFSVHDAARGEVSILHGTSEVIVQDRRLVARILDAASRAAK